MTDSNLPVQPETDKPVYETSAPWIVHGLVSLVIFIVAVMIVRALFADKPSASRWGDRPAPMVAVEIAPLKETSFDVWVDSYGTADALTNTALVTEINGRVINVSPKIRAGGQFKKGDLLVELDPQNYQIEINIAASAAADAEVAYLQEVAQAEFAAQEWNERPQSEAARRLALREPQVAAAKASLEAAQARLKRAKLDLERTKIVAPFDGKVLQQRIDVGQFVTPSQSIADIYSTEAVEVRLPIKISDLEHLILPEGEDARAIAPKVVLQSDMGSKTYQWEAEIVRTEGAFDTATRMLYIVAQVKEPFVGNEDRPAMRIGQFLSAKVEGKRYDNVFAIPRRAVSQDNTVSIAQQGILQKRVIEPLWTDSDFVIVSAINNDELQADAIGTDITPPSSVLLATDMLILTPTANLPDGTRIRPLRESNERNRPESIGAVTSDSSMSKG